MLIPSESGFKGPQNIPHDIEDGGIVNIDIDYISIAVIY